MKYQEKVLNLFVYHCLSVILIYSACRTGKNYYPQLRLEVGKYVVKEKKMPKYIINDIEISSYSDRENSDEENSDKETSDEKHSDEENSVKENFDEETFDEESFKIFFINFFLYI